MDDEANTDVADDTVVTDVDTSEDGTVVTETPDAAEEGAEQQDQTDDQSDKSEGDESNKAPEEYSDFNVPEGFENLDDALLEKAVPVLKELGATQEQAQSFVDMFADSLSGHAESQSQAFTELNKANAEACKTHEEYGGDKFDASVSKCAKAIDQVMGESADGFREMLNQTGLGNHPLMFELLTKVGKSISEDGIVDGSKSVKAVSTAEAFYGEDGQSSTTET